MDKGGSPDKAEANPILPVTSPNAASTVEFEGSNPPKFSIINRSGTGTSGKRVALLANHFKANINVPDAVFYQYNVTILQDNKKVEGKGISRKIIDRLYRTYHSELANRSFAYDGEGILYTGGQLPQNRFEFTVVLEESFVGRGSGDGESPGSPIKRSRQSFQSKTFSVEISYAASIPLKSIALVLRGAAAEHDSFDPLRVLAVVLRQEAANRGCLLVRQSFFLYDSANTVDVGGGVTGIRGFHSSFRTTQGGLSLNMDMSTTMILTPGPVINFLLANQNVKEPRYIDWAKAKKMLKNMRVKTSHRNMEFKIIGLSEKPCNQQYFQMKPRNSNGVGDGQTIEITVSEYFSQHLGIELESSLYLPCLDVGKSKRPIYLPMELCSLVPLQRYKKALSALQRASLVEKSRQKPPERMRILSDAVKNCRYNEDPVLVDCGISIAKHMTKVEGRVLETPKLKVGNNNECIPQNGRWNFNQKTFIRPIKVDRWVIVNFSARCDTSRLSRDLIDCGRTKGMQIECPVALIEEDPQQRREGPVARVEKMFELIRMKLSRPPKFILCALPERKISDIYGPWKKKCLTEFGIVTQCISPLKINDQYLTNVLLKINSKLGGINSLLAIEHASCIPKITDTPTMILGMDVSHGSPGRSDMPSISAVVGSRCWPLISQYRASVRTQSPKLEIIDALYKPLANGEDDGIMRELLLDFYESSKGRKPTQIIVFRDGVSETQFNQVLDIELQQIVKAYNHLGETSVPKFTVIVAQKNHHTKLFQANASENVSPGTVVDTEIVHPRNYDFYMCSHAGSIGTSRPAHYHVLIDENGFSVDELQNLIHSLSYVYQRSTSAISIVAPIYYAHLAARQMGQFVKFEDLSETSSGGPIPELPRLHEEVESSMFFC
ncbi:protein argonaute 16 isoform X2 [Punica granatum]|uniref:Protein argonaute 16 isoform X2 n=1 Tax=Punica granatum TaxID=22663 RepID=A0A6P8CLI4_PUNGR|nr:protein argonaute 16 isoform X2 [Punica granatum]